MQIYLLCIALQLHMTTYMIENLLFNVNKYIILASNMINIMGPWNAIMHKSYTLFHFGLTDIIFIAYTSMTAHARNKKGLHSPCQDVDTLWDNQSTMKMELNRLIWTGVHRDVTCGTHVSQTIKYLKQWKSAYRHIYGWFATIL